MIDVEQQIRAELDRLVEAPAPPDWSEVLTLAGHRKVSAGRRWAMAIGAFAATAGIVVAVAVATPLGAAIAHGFGGFSAWISGEPGSPAPKPAQQAFARANARSWHGFPAGTQLRQLLTVTNPANGHTVRLLGFRSGDTLCIRIALTGASQQSCAPLADLRQAGAPVRVVLVDQGFGKGTKHAWYGIDRIGSPALQITAGIAADGVKSVVLEDNSGRHTVPAESNAFLYLAPDPAVGQRVSKIWAHTASGLIPVPFAPSPFGFFPGIGGTAQRAATGPTQVQRHVSGGTIGWLDKHETLGQSLDVLHGSNGRIVRRHVIFGRIITPDPNNPTRIALTLSASHNGGRPTGVCTWVIASGNGAGGGCAVRARLFSNGPVSGGTGFGGGSGEFETVTGLASDDVARIVAFLANGQTQPIPLTDNIYVAEIARSKFPARLVSYDSAGRIIGVEPTLRGFGGIGNGGGSPAQGKARALLHIVSPSGATAELLVGKSTTGGQCMYVRTYVSKRANGVEVGCAPPTWQGLPIQLGGGGPAGIFSGRVRDDVATVELRFADGGEATIKPTDGFILYAAPKNHVATGHQLIAATARNAAGKALGTQSFEPRKRKSG